MTDPAGPAAVTGSTAPAGPAAPADPAAPAAPTDPAAEAGAPAPAGPTARADPAVRAGAAPAGDPVAENRRRQRELYGEPLGERVRRLTSGLGITQARLASALGLSPAMLSQLAGARRVKIGDPAVLGRLLALDRRVRRGPVPAGDVESLLDGVRSGSTPWGPGAVCGCGAASSGPQVPAPRPADGVRVLAVPVRPTPGWAGRQERAAAADDALRGVSAPARLVAAAAVLAPSFPEVAEVLRRAAARR
ncbi:helix-turn-helix domain-containing protein [Pseudonocardia nematodicida]|uniref:Helix-turn-helix domain-containing protein n=1 Tax=Pseudonocardia nematodicida TaxID=1206997 RepID=A0ABV1KKM7_9PSEU